MLWSDFWREFQVAGPANAEPHSSSFRRVAGCSYQWHVNTKRSICSSLPGSGTARIIQWEFTQTKSQQCCTKAQSCGLRSFGNQQTATAERLRVYSVVYKVWLASCAQSAAHQKRKNCTTTTTSKQKTPSGHNVFVVYDPICWVFSLDFPNKKVFTLTPQWMLLGLHSQGYELIKASIYFWYQW